MTNKKYRQGAVGALMDEYERAAHELKKLVSQTGQVDFVKIMDPRTSDPACRSIQTIMNHVVRAGYGYANYIRWHFGDSIIPTSKHYEIKTPDQACLQLDRMLDYTVETLDNKWNLTHEDVLNNKMKTSWGQEYDFEQMMEHAIVHILRHRRQIERFLGIMDE